MRQECVIIIIMMVVLSLIPISTFGSNGDDKDDNDDNKDNNKKASHCAPVDYDVLEYCTFGNQTFACTDKMTWCFDAKDRLKIIK